MSNVEVIDFVRQRIAKKMNPGEVRNYLAMMICTVVTDCINSEL